MLDYPEACYHTGHCTGRRAYGVLKEVMGDRVTSIKTGTVLDL